MNRLINCKLYTSSYLTVVIHVFLSTFLMTLATVAQANTQANNIDSHKFQSKFYDRARSSQSFDIKQVNNGHAQPKRYRFGDHYRAYKKKYRDKKNYHSPHDLKRQYHSKRRYKHQAYNHRQHYKPLRQHHRHFGFKTNYWSAHKRHGYRYKRVGRHHYYYNNLGFYFPGLGLIKHGHQHNDHCDDWHFSALLASSVLFSIYHK